MGLSDIDEDDDDIVVTKPNKPTVLHNKETGYTGNARSKLSQNEELNVNEYVNYRDKEQKESSTNYVTLDDLFGSNRENINLTKMRNVEQKSEQKFVSSPKTENSSTPSFTKINECNIVRDTVKCVMGDIKLGRCVQSDEEIHDVVYEARPVAQAKPNTLSTEHQQQYSNTKNTGIKEHDVLDNLFATPTCAESPEGSKVNDNVNTIIYVDGPESEYENNHSNLLDLSKPSQRKRHDDAESFLKAFEQQGKKRTNDRIRYEKEDSLQKLTRNKDDNKVKARLLALMNYYDVLGVSSNATLEEIKASYKRKALELHPDKVGDKQTPEEAELFKIITKAHEVLSDDQQRAEYDAELQTKSS